MLFDDVPVSDASLYFNIKQLSSDHELNFEL